MSGSFSGVNVPTELFIIWVTLVAIFLVLFVIMLLKLTD